MAIGSDGTVIICTHSGHVFVRQRVKSGSGQLKFRRIPYIQRAIKVACNESGAFAAIRVDARATPIALVGRTLEEDMALLQPHYRRYESQMTAEDFERAGHKADEEEDEDEGSNSVHRDLASAHRLCTILRRWRNDEMDTLFAWSAPLVGSDVQLVVGDIAIPAHRTILAMRVPALGKVFKGEKVARIKLAGTRIILDVCHPLVALLLLQYIYSDDVAAVWDARVARAIQSKFVDLKLPIGDIKSDLKSLADTLSLTPLSTILESAGKVQMPKRTLPLNLQTFFTSTNAQSTPSCDVIIRLAEKEVHCSSVILRSRCPFFEAMFADRDWTTDRLEGGNVVVDMTHLKWTPMRMVFRYIHEGQEDDLFDYLRESMLMDLGCA